ncbi:MAG: TonB C-terminal domain-containing protein, partial [Desulfovibrionaceae bacterium]|nr:TonB C-terminal domain-containing protein [Desulfovibrionaceae bacterium]
GQRAVEIMATIDPKGHVLACKVIKPSDLEAFDSVACSAVYAAAPLPRPNGNEDVFIYFFQDTKRDLTTSNEPLSDMASMRSLVDARERFDQAMRIQAASQAHEKARIRAEEAAKQLNRDLGSKEAEKPLNQDFGPKEAAKPLNHDLGKNAVKLTQDKALAFANGPSQTQTEKDKGITPEDLAAYQSYTQELARFLEENLQLNASKPLSFTYVTLQLTFSAKGLAKNVKIIAGTGQKNLDQQILSGVLRLKNIPRPPKNLLAKPITVLWQPRYIR